MSSDNSRLAIFMSFSGQGGVEKMMLNLITAIHQQGVAIDLIAVNRNKDNLANYLPPGVNLIQVPGSHTKLAIFTLTKYLLTHRPKSLLVAKERAFQVAMIAKWISFSSDLKVFVRLGTNISAFLETKSSWVKYARGFLSRRFLPKANRIIAVSDGVASDIQLLTRISADKIKVINNPVITAEFEIKAMQQIKHRWINDNAPPLLVAAGRFTEQKGFNCLLRAFAEVLKQQQCKLIILGDGSLRSELENLAYQLNIATNVDFPGHMANILPYFKHASLFVLSSLWEGSPNVLTEALAVGTAVVATDCPSGPKEILQDGKFGKLVPMGDHLAMADAILASLKNPLPAAYLQQAVTTYRADICASHYMETMAIETEQKTVPSKFIKQNRFI